MATPETAPPDTKPPTTITLRTPSKYLSKSSSSPTTTVETPFFPPPPDWLYGTWCVTHSTLPMWRTAQNVRISYKPLSSSTTTTTTAATPPPIDDLVEYEKKSGGGAVKTVEGVDKPDAATAGAWNWRGKGWLRFVSSHWEVLGWGERPLVGRVGEMGEGVERWAVTWFAPTIFSREGVDIYSDRKEGLSAETVEGILAALKKLDAPAVVQMVEKDMRDVEIKLPWKERS